AAAEEALVLLHAGHHRAAGDVRLEGDAAQIRDPRERELVEETAPRRGDGVPHEIDGGRVATKDPVPPERETRGEADAPGQVDRVVSEPLEERIVRGRVLLARDRRVRGGVRIELEDAAQA